MCATGTASCTQVPATREAEPSFSQTAGNSVDCFCLPLGLLVAPGYLVNPPHRTFRASPPCSTWYRCPSLPKAVSQEPLTSALQLRLLCLSLILIIVSLTFTSEEHHFAVVAGSAFSSNTNGESMDQRHCRRQGGSTILMARLRCPSTATVHSRPRPPASKTTRYPHVVTRKRQI